MDGDADGTITCHTGAYELLRTLVVSSTNDRVDSDTGDGMCGTEADPEECTLRAAIGEANALGRVELITVPAGVYRFTHALLADSPAIDAGDVRACPERDQRHLSRPVNGDGDGTSDCDIGAYEFRPVADPGDPGNPGDPIDPVSPIYLPALLK